MDVTWVLSRVHHGAGMGFDTEGLARYRTASSWGEAGGKMLLPAHLP